MVFFVLLGQCSKKISALVLVLSKGTGILHWFTCKTHRVIVGVSSPNGNILILRCYCHSWHSIVRNQKIGRSIVGLAKPLSLFTWP
jgi:hypothetical protein